MDRQWMELEPWRGCRAAERAGPAPRSGEQRAQQLVAPARWLRATREQLSAMHTDAEQHGRLVGGAGAAGRARRGATGRWRPERTSTEVDAAATRLQAEHDELARALALAKDQLALAQTAELDLKARLEQSQTEIDKGIQELSRERRRRLGTAAAPAAAGLRERPRRIRERQPSMRGAAGRQRGTQLRLPSFARSWTPANAWFAETFRTNGLN